MLAPSSLVSCLTWSKMIYSRSLWQMSISPYRSNTDLSCKRFVPAWTPPTISMVSMEELILGERPGWDGRFVHSSAQWHFEPTWLWNNPNGFKWIQTAMMAMKHDETCLVCAIITKFKRSRIGSMCDHVCYCKSTLSSKKLHLSSHRSVGPKNVPRLRTAAWLGWCCKWRRDLGSSIIRIIHQVVGFGYVWLCLAASPCVA